MAVPRFFLVLAVSYGSAASYASLRVTRWRGVLLIPLCLPILLSPLLVPPRMAFLRLLASVQVVMLVVKLYDLHRHAQFHQPRWRTVLAYLPNPFLLVLREANVEPKPRAIDDATRTFVFGSLAIVGTFLLVLVFHVPWRRYPFLLEHGAKVLALFSVLVSLGAAGCSLFRLLGLPAHEIMHNPFAARTPADFWRRYNRPVNRFLRRYVFKPAGGRRRPIIATLIVFAVSGLIHEYVFDVLSLRTAGLQMAFFFIQGCAVVVTARVKPRGVRAVSWVAGTLCFNLLTGVLFFTCVNEAIPFYVRR